MIHLGPPTTRCADYLQVVYFGGEVVEHLSHGLVSAHPKAKGARNFTQCDSLLIGKPLACAAPHRALHHRGPQRSRRSKFEHEGDHDAALRRPSSSSVMQRGLQRRRRRRCNCCGQRLRRQGRAAGTLPMEVRRRGPEAGGDQPGGQRRMNMPTRKNAPTTLSLRHAFEVEQARREAERYAREEADRRQQEEDLSRAEQLYDALICDPAFLTAHNLTADWRRYSVHLESPEFRITRLFRRRGPPPAYPTSRRQTHMSPCPPPHRLRLKRRGGRQRGRCVSAWSPSVSPCYTTRSHDVERFEPACFGRRQGDPERADPRRPGRRSARDHAGPNVPGRASRRCPACSPAATAMEVTAGGSATLDGEDLPGATRRMARGPRRLPVVPVSAGDLRRPATDLHPHRAHFRPGAGARGEAEITASEVPEVDADESLRQRP